MAGHPGQESINPLDAYEAGQYPEDILGIAEQGHLRDALGRERGKLADLQQYGCGPDSQEAKPHPELDVRIAQLLNALNQSESCEFWQAVTGGCSAQLAALEETDPCIRHAEALLGQWRADRRAHVERQFEAKMQANMSPSGRAWSAIQFTQELLIEEAEYRLKTYKEVADGFQRLEMLAPANLDRLRCKMAHHVALSMVARKDAISRYFSAAGWVDPQPPYRRYIYAAFGVLESIDATLAVLRTAYELQITRMMGDEANSPNRLSAGLATAAQREHRRQILETYKRQNSISSQEALAKHVGIGLSSIQAMVREDKRKYGRKNLDELLKKIKCPRDMW
jgi:hypothetical protein